MIYNVAKVRRLFTKFQVDTYKTKRDRFAHEKVSHLVVEIQAMIYNAAKVRRLPTKFQVDTSKTKKGKTNACAVAPSHDLYSCTPCNSDSSHDFRPTNPPAFCGSLPHFENTCLQFQC